MERVQLAFCCGCGVLLGKAPIEMPHQCGNCNEEGTPVIGEFKADDAVLMLANDGMASDD